MKEKQQIKTDYTNDFQTPMPVAFHMAHMIPKGAKRILEPTPGQGNLVKAAQLISGGEYQIEYPKDFFLVKNLRDKYFDCVIMNPPFSSKYANMKHAPKELTEKGLRLGYHILTECMNASDHVIALMPWFTISDSDVRLKFLKRWGLKSLTALSRKTFQYARVQTVIIELQKDFRGETAFKTFDFNTKDTHYDTITRQTFIPSDVNEDGDVRHTGVADKYHLGDKAGKPFETWLLKKNNSFIQYK